jgi:hypothetical protein
MPMLNIRQLQIDLNALGASPQLTVDGWAGKMTRDAVKAFKIAHHLPADSIPDYATQAAIQTALGVFVPPLPAIPAGVGYCRIGNGLGGNATSPGMAALQQQVIAKFPKVICPAPFDGEDEAQVVQDFMAQPANMPLILIGYSWDADNTSLIAAAIYGRRRIAFLFAYQPSVYYPTVPIGDNVDVARCVYNPNWIATFGLGYEQLALAPGNGITDFQLIPTTDSHPAVQFDTAYHELCLDGIGKAVGA